IGQNVFAAGGGFWMRVNDCATPVEFVENRIESWIAEPFGVVACVHGHAVSLESVETVFDLLQASVDVRHGEVDEHAKAALVIGNQARRFLVGTTGQTPGGCVVAMPYARRRERQD